MIHYTLMQEKRLNYIFMVIAAVLVGFITIFSAFARNYGVSMMEQSIFRLVLVPIIVAPIFLIKSKWFTLTWKDIPLFVAYGFVLSSLNYSQFGSIALGVPVAIVIFLLYLQPAFTAIISHIYI